MVNRLVIVCRGRDWALMWPKEKWERLTDRERQDVIAVQTALMSQNVALPRPTPAARGIRPPVAQ